jgi:reversibly glycosylated polypeptide / UDP-arabinopyranose mutase
MKTLVMASNRAECLRIFADKWREVRDWDEWIVVWDGPQSSVPDVPDAARVLSWDSIEQQFGDDHWIISRKTSGIRIAGYIEAARRGATVIATTDDDCYPTGDPFMQRHCDALFHAEKWTATAFGMTARGMPYRNKGTVGPVHVNVGLWRNVGDYDAPRSLVLEADLKPYEPPTERRVIAAGQYAPISSMNTAFRVEALPLMYMPLMGQGQPYDRFEDIWSGILLKKVCDQLGWLVTAGTPVVEHRRASDPFRNLVKEAAGIGRNETFWQDVDGVQFQCNSSGDCMNELAAALASNEDPHTRQLGKAIPVWVKHASSI